MHVLVYELPDPLTVVQLSLVPHLASRVVIVPLVAHVSVVAADPPDNVMLVGEADAVTLSDELTVIDQAMKFVANKGFMPSTTGEKYSEYVPGVLVAFAVNTNVPYDPGGTLDSLIATGLFVDNHDVS